MDDLASHTNLSPIRRGFVPGFVYYKKGCFRLTATSDKVYQLLAHGWWFSPGTPASSTTKTGRHDIAEILLKVALNTKIQIQILFWTQSEDVCFGDQSEDVCLETQSENVCFGDTISGRLLWRPIRGRLLWIFFWRCNQRTSFSDTEQRTYFLEELYSAVLKLCSTFMLRGSLYGLYQLVKC